MTHLRLASAGSGSLDTVFPLLRGSAVGQLLLALQYGHKRLGCFQTQELLVLNADAVGQLRGLLAQLADLGVVSRTGREGQVVELCADIETRVTVPT